MCISNRRAGRHRRSAVAALLAAGVLLVVSAAARVQAAAAAEPARAHSFFRNADVGAMQLSPSGAWLAFTIGGGTTRVALAVVDIEHKSPPVIAASAPDADIRSFRWVTDERLVFNVVDLQSGGRDQTFGPGL